MKAMSLSLCDDRHRLSSTSPTGRIRKSSAERREKKKVEEKLRSLVGLSEECSEQDQLVLIHSVISYIRELQSQLHADKENGVPAELDALMVAMAVESEEKSEQPLGEQQQREKKLKKRRAKKANTTRTQTTLSS